MNNFPASWAGYTATRNFWILLVGAVVVFAIAQVTINTINGFWVDEYFSNWISDPARPDFLSLVTRDTNPPVYFTLLHVVRSVFTEPRTAYIIISLVIVLMTAALVLWTASRAQLLRLGIVAISAFLLSGPAFNYFPEGRTYFVGMCLAFAASWIAGLVVTNGGTKNIWIALAVVGALSSLTHVFAALFAGSLAAGMVAQGLFSRKRDVIFSGLALGAAASLVFIIWFKTATFTLNAVTWIEFSAAHVADAFYFARHLLTGPTVMLAPLLFLAGYGLFIVGARPLVIVFGITFALFAALPIAISFQTPILTGRYWAIGTPAVTVFVVFLARAFLFDTARWSRYAAAGAAGFLVLCSGFGYLAAREYTLDKPVWQGADLVKSLGQSCGPNSIHAVALPLPPFAPTNFMAGFGMATGLPDSTFVDPMSAGVRKVSAGDCAVLGWSVHIMAAKDIAAPDDVLLDRVRLAADPGQVKIVRFDRDYVVLNAAKAPAQ